MKRTNRIFAMLTVILVGFAFTQCTEDPVEVIENYSISGAVTYPDFDGTATPAAGAVVYMKMNATAATTNYDVATIADASGNYSFAEVADGDHFVFANYNTNNDNLPGGRMVGIVFGGEGAMVTVAGAVATQALALESMGQANAMAVNTYEGGDWAQDWNHSSVGFEFPYDGENAVYTGRFKASEIYVDFDPASLGTSKIEATIDLLTIITDSPGGRDPLYNSDGTLWQDVDLSYDLGCISGTFGIADPADADRYSSFTATTITAYGDGYLATGAMVFNGVTSDVDMFFQFVPGFEGTDRSGNPTQFSSFRGTFEFDALGAFGIESGHVLDKMVTVSASFQIKKTL